MSRRPLVSVYLPTHDRAALLVRAIDSVLTQSHDELELVVVDDGSRDETPQVLEAAAKRDSRVRVIRRDRPGGPAAARNEAIRLARGEFVLGLDDDDWILPEHVERLLAAYSPEVSLVCSGCWLDSGRWLRPEAPGPELVTLQELLHANRINPSLTQRVRMLEVGLFDETLAAWEDYDLWTRMVTHYGPARRLADCTMVRRVDPQAQRVTTSTRAPQGARQYFERYRHLMNASQQRSQRLLQCAVDERRLGLREAVACWGPGTRLSVLRSWVSGNLPASRTVRDAWWRLRWSRARFPYLRT
jgi:glycosyltransferase involved in cell wall biosynthesis